MHYLTQDELKRLLRELPSDLHRLLVLVTMYHGLRASESLSLTGKDIEGGYVTKDRLKGSRPCSQPYVVHDDPELDESALLKKLKVCRHCGCNKLEITVPIPCLEGKSHEWRALKPTERLFPMYSAAQDESCENSTVGRYGFYQMMKRAGTRAGLPPKKRKPHVLKHTCGMIAVADGVHYAQERLGHKNMSNTAVYIRVSEQKSSKAFAKTALRLKDVLDD